MNTIQIITAIKDILLGAAAIITAIVAFRGLRTWQRELMGKKTFETAMDLMRATYKLRDELAVSRSALLLEIEFPEEYRSKATRSSEDKAQAYYYAFKNRYAPVRGANQVFNVSALEAELFWGDKIREKTDILADCAKELGIAMEAFVDNEASDGLVFSNDEAFGKEIRAQVFNLDKKNNQFTKRIEAAVEDIKRFMFPHLKSISN
jgi:hypothetical protein